MSEIQIPETYEEVVKRKEELLEKINEYNTAFFNNTELPYSEEEIDEFQEELEYLEDTFNESRIEVEEVKVDEKDKKFFDKVSPFIWVYSLIAIFASLWFVVEFIGYQFFSAYINSFPSSDSFYAFLENHGGLFSFTCYMLYAIYPLIIIILTVVLKFVIFKKRENKIFSLICMIIIVLECIGSYLISVL